MFMNKRMIWVVMLLLALGWDARAGEVRRVLTLGNCLTMVNDVDGLTRQIAQAAGEKAEFARQANGGYSLQNHTGDRRSLAVLESKPWDAVLLWEHSAVLASERLCRESMLPAGRALCERIRARKGRPILVMVWGRQHGDTEAMMGETIRYKDYDEIQEIERQACERCAKELNVEVAPVGLAWRAFRQRYLGVELHQDQMHANASGAYLAALVIYATIYEKSPRAITFYPPQLTHDQAVKLRDVAADVYEQYAAAKKSTKEKSVPVGTKPESKEKE
jgi:hypothetical protein